MAGNKKRVISQISVLLIFLLGLLIMLYPFYINALNGVIAEYTVMKYQKKETQDFEKQKAILEKENQKLTETGLNPGSDPFKEEAKVIQNNEELKKHVIGKINIPKLAIEIPLFDKTTPYLLEHGATVLDGTSAPIGGVSTHSVISAHRGLPNRELLTNLPDLKEKDIFLVEVFEETLAYEVSKIEVVLPNETSGLEIVPDEDLVTLVTCTPYMINTHRLLVTGHRVPYTAAIKQEKLKKDNWRKFKEISLIVGTIFILLMGLLAIFRQIANYRLSKKKINIKVRVKVKDFREPLLVSLYEKKGKHPIKRNNVNFVYEVTSSKVVNFKQVPGGVYCLKINEKLVGRIGIKKSTQKEVEMYQTNYKVKKSKQGIHIIYYRT